MQKSKKVVRGAFKILTGVVIGSAIGSILGLTLAPKKGEDTRKYLKEKSMDVFLRSKEAMNTNPNIGLVKRFLIKLLTRKK